MAWCCREVSGGSCELGPFADLSPKRQTACSATVARTAVWCLVGCCALPGAVLPPKPGPPGARGGRPTSSAPAGPPLCPQEIDAYLEKHGLPGAAQA